MKSEVKRKKVYFITVVIGFAICMVGVIFGSRLVFQRTCERRTTPWSDLGTADDDEYRILIDAYKIKNQSNETVMIQAFDNTKLVGHYYEREKGAPLIVFFHGLWGHSYLDGVPIYRITQKHNWNLLLCDLRAQGDSEGEFSTLGVLEKYDCLDWVEWAQNRFGDKNPIFLMGVSMGASIVMMSSDLELPDSVYGIIDDCGFTSTLDVIKQNNNKKISKYIPKNLLPTMLNVGTKIWGSFDLSDADACKALAHTDIPLLIIHGDEDMKAPLSMAYKLYDSCNGEKQLYIVHGADHSENYRKDPGGYEKVVTKFIEERLRQKKCQTPGTNNAELVNTMLDNAIVLLKENEHPIVHSDRGCHYRWSGWIQRMDEAGLTRSMSKKGCSPDNSACEGFFGRMKNEMFCGEKWDKISVEEFISIINQYMQWYRDKRIKLSLGGLSPMEYRRSLGIA